MSVLAVAAAVLAWQPVAPATQVVDVVGPRADGRLLVATNGRLAHWRPGDDAVRPFAPAYSTQPGFEPYIALSSGRRMRGRCRWPRGTVYALEPAGPQPGVIAISRAGRVRRLADLPGAGLLNGVVFDTAGRFGNRLLVTAGEAGRTTLFAVDCRGRARALTRGGPAVEGGLAVAPRGFGRFAGRLIAPDEVSGRIWSFDARGVARAVAESGLPAGGDVGVESAGFVPRGFGRRWTAYLADRSVPGNPHPGSDQILALGGRGLVRAGVRAGDLLVASEGGAQTIAVRCRRRACTVRHVADGPAVAHAEGHITFARR